MNWHFFSTSLDSRRPRWLWACIDDDHCVVEHAESSFPSYAACLADALAHGYAGCAVEPLEAGG